MGYTLEIWKPVLGFEGRYEVSNIGNVRSIILFDSRGQKRTPKFLKKSQEVRNNKVVRVFVTLTDGLGGKFTRKIHTLVMEAFTGKRENGMHICHNNGDATDNRLSNLRYDTPSGNERDKLSHNTHSRGAKNINAKLTLEQVIEIKKLDLTKYGSLKKASEKYNVSSVTISHIQKGRQWSWLNNI
jgi:hypothetical protein